MKKIFFLSLITFMLSSADVFAGKRYWIAATPSNWNSTANWSTFSGGAGGATIPGSNDTAYYDAAKNGNCSIDANVNIKYLNIASGHTGIISQETYSITIGTTGAVLSGGTFTGGSAGITVSGPFTISGCAFTSTSGTFSTNSNFTLSSGSFAHNSGRMKFTATCTITGSITTYDLEIAPTGNNTFTIASGTVITVNNHLYTSGSNQFTLNTGTIDVKKNIYMNNTGVVADGGTALIKISGTTKQTIFGTSAICSVLPHIEINKTDTLLLEDTISLGGNFTYTAGIVDAGMSTVEFKDGVSRTISGSVTLYNVVFNHYYYNSSYAISGGATITVNNDLTIAGNRIFTLSSGTIHVKHDFINNNSSTSGGGGTSLIVFNGAGTQKIQGSTTASTGRTCSIQISKSASDTLKISNYLTVTGNWTYSTGIVDAGSSTIYMYNTKTISGSHTLNAVVFSGSANSTYTISSGTVLTAAGTLTTAGSANLVFNTGTIVALGNITVSNTYASGGGGTAMIKIEGTGDQTFTGGGWNTARLPDIRINKSSGTLYLSGTISVSGDWIYVSGTLSAGSSTVYFAVANVTGTHSLNNVVFQGGNTHVINTGTILTAAGNATFSTGGLNAAFTGTLHVEGNLSVSGATSTINGGGSGTIILDGTGNQNITGTTTIYSGRLCSIQINKSSGTLTITDRITVLGNWTYTAGTIDPGTSIIMFAGTKTISGTNSLYAVLFDGNNAATYTIASGTTLTVGGSLSFYGAAAITLNTGIIHAKGGITTTNTSTSTGGSATIVFNGTGEQTLTGSGTAGAGKLPNITIDKTSGTLILSSIISVTGNWTYVKGSVASGTSSVALYGTFNLDGQEEGSSNTMSFYRVGIQSGTRTLTGNLDVNDNLTSVAGTTLAIGNNNVKVGGNWNLQGTFTQGATSLVTFDGSNYNKIQGPSGSIVAFKKIAIDRRAGSVKLVNPVKIDSSMTLLMGRIKTDTINYLEFGDNATCIVNNDDSAYVHGPVRKVGNDAFSFPLGDTTLHDSIAYHPLGITAPGSVTDRFMAQYYGNKHSVGDSLVDSLADVSDYEYWSLNRQVGTSNVIVTLSWNRNSLNVQDYNTLRVANWNGSKWLDLGGTNINVSNRTGSVTAVAPPSYVSNSAVLTISNMVWTQDYAVLHRKLDGGYYLVKNGALYFTYDEEYNDTDDKLSFTIYDQQRRVVASGSGTYALPLTSDYGDNRFFISLFDCNLNASGPLGAGTFILEVTNEKNEKWMLRFKHVTTITPFCPGGGGGGQ